MKVSKLLTLDPKVVKGLSLQAIEKGITFKKHAETILTNASLPLEQRIEDFYNRDKEKFTPYSQISQKNREVIVEILNNK